MYTRLFASIVNSSVWCEDAETKVVWITLLALCDPKGYVFAAVPGLAKAAGVSLEATRRALAKFQEPDPDSGDIARNPENEGRRIEPIDGGWFVVNHSHYLGLQGAEDRRDRVKAKARERAKRHREKQKTAPEDNANVTPDNASSVTRDAPVTHKSVTRNAPFNIATTVAVAETEAIALAPDAHARVPGRGERGSDLPTPLRPLPPTADQVDARRELVEHFRREYIAHADPGYRFQGGFDPDSFETETAGALMAAHPLATIHAVIRFVVTDRPNDKWPGWSRSIKSLDALRRKWPDVEQRMRDAKECPPETVYADRDRDIFRKTTFEEWRMSVVRSCQQLEFSFNGKPHEALVAAAIEDAGQRYGWQMRPYPSHKEPGAHPWKGSGRR